MVKATVRKGGTVRGLLTDVLRTLVPRAGDRDGPLPPLMLLLTVVTGLVDAVSCLALGHVFVANMTGNVVFLCFAPAGADELSAAGSPDHRFGRARRGHPCQARNEARRS